MTQTMNMKELLKMLKSYSQDMHVLYVEDDPHVRAETSAVLKGLFGTLHIAVDGQDGWDKYEKCPYDLVISDIKMPVMNGIELVKRIRSLNNTQTIVITSAHDDSGILLELINLGVDKFIIKPLKGQILFSALLQVCKWVKMEKDVENYKIQVARLSAAKELIRNISHHWRNSLNGLALVIQDIAYDTEKTDHQRVTSTVKDAMDIIKDMSETINKINRDMEPEGTKALFCVNDCIDNALLLINGKLQNHSIQPVKEIEEVVYHTGDKSKLVEALLHILDNAVDSLKKNTPEVPAITIGLRNEKGKTVLSITDNGGGIEEEVLQKVFDPYFTTKFPSNGVGLSLYTAKNIIENDLQGVLRARSYNNMAEFSIELQPLDG